MSVGKIGIMQCHTLGDIDNISFINKYFVPKRKGLDERKIRI